MVEGHGGQGDVGVGGLGVSVTITARSGHDVMQGSGHCKLQCMADHLGCKQTTEEWVADLTIISPKLDPEPGRSVPGAGTPLSPGGGPALIGGAGRGGGWY